MLTRLKPYNKTLVSALAGVALFVEAIADASISTDERTALLLSAVATLSVFFAVNTPAEA